MDAALMALFLFVALAIGFGLGLLHTRKRQANTSTSHLNWPQKRYYEGLTQLLNDQPDAAIETFIAALEVNSETLETHLALGSLLRKRGEVSRAIRVHQNLLARPVLTTQQSHLAQLELAIDYLRAGLLDRAEALLKELIAIRGIDKALGRQATEYLLDVYQELREWLWAIDTADRLTAKKFAANTDIWSEKQAQFSCEIAEAAIEEKDWLTARRWLRSALRYDKKCVRANLLLARLEMSLEDYQQAVIALRSVAKQDERFAVEILAPLFECYKKLSSLEELHKELATLYQQKPQLVTLRYLAKAKELTEGGDAAVSLLMQELPRYPKMEPAGELLHIVADERGPTSLRNYVRIKGVLEKLTDARQQYLCRQCGFEGRQLHWLCPSCKTWSSISLVSNEAQSAPHSGRHNTEPVMS